MYVSNEKSFEVHGWFQLRWLNLTANKWSVNGTWLGMSTMKGAGLQQCAGDWTSQNAAFRSVFGQEL